MNSELGNVQLNLILTSIKDQSCVIDNDKT